MAAICPACNKDMAGRGRFISGCCGQSCCAECMLIVEVTTCKETLDEQDEWHYVPEPFNCEKKDGETCDQIIWVREIISARNTYLAQTRLIMLEHEAKKKADKLDQIRLTNIRLQSSANTVDNGFLVQCRGTEKGGL